MLFSSELNGTVVCMCTSIFGTPIKAYIWSCRFKPPYRTTNNLALLPNSRQVTPLISTLSLYLFRYSFLFRSTLYTMLGTVHGLAAGFGTRITVAVKEAASGGTRVNPDGRYHVVIDVILRGESRRRLGSVPKVPLNISLLQFALPGLSGFFPHFFIPAFGNNNKGE